MRDKSQESGTEATKAELIAAGFELIGRALVSMNYAARTTAAGQDLLLIAGRLSAQGRRDDIAATDAGAMFDAISERIAATDLRQGGAFHRK
ncbi:hypothetical protein [Cupriavidus gilardii]|uniref:hypothetical protein n=1 Tax=Cupriavidus gilardii TaxID=82541 RepID=UPI0021B35E40|nr:hypothetical protein [Cupriavidus gilardii]UXC34807.1 hypothetical protein N4G38_10170 [Cupriavidus gilardii]